MEQWLRVESNEILKVKRKQLDKAEKCILELDKLFVRIYEDNVAGKLSDERFAVMSSSYGEEQQSLKTDSETLRQEIEVQEQQNQDLELFIQKVHQTRKSRFLPEKAFPPVLPEGIARRARPYALCAEKTLAMRPAL